LHSGGDSIPTNREIAAFEAGIKLGALYHQFVGTPVNVETASILELAMQKSISLQPHVNEIEVSIDRQMIKENNFGYAELSGEMITAELEIDFEGESVKARLEYDKVLDYPLMKLL
jgi:hypothetical protein